MRTPDPVNAQRPLRRWTRRVPLRDYQQNLLDRLHPDDGSTLHLLAPPGAGKTLMGLELAVRNGRRALVLTPTTVIRAQWSQQASEFFARNEDESLTAGHQTPNAPENQDRELLDLTVLTYQSLSVVDDATPWNEAARSRWVSELTADGKSPASARTWLTPRPTHAASVRALPPSDAGSTS